MRARTRLTGLRLPAAGLAAVLAVTVAACSSGTTNGSPQLPTQGGGSGQSGASVSSGGSQSAPATNTPVADLSKYPGGTSKITLPTKTTPGPDTCTLLSKPMLTALVPTLGANPTIHFRTEDATLGGHKWRRTCQYNVSKASGGADLTSILIDMLVPQFTADINAATFYGQRDANRKKPGFHDYGDTYGAQVWYASGAMNVLADGQDFTIDGRLASGDETFLRTHLLEPIVQNLVARIGSIAKQNPSPSPSHKANTNNPLPASVDPGWTVKDVTSSPGVAGGSTLYDVAYVNISHAQVQAYVAHLRSMGWHNDPTALPSKTQFDLIKGSALLNVVDDTSVIQVQYAAKR